jgi:hypothetical protein
MILSRDLLLAIAAAASVVQKCLPFQRPSDNDRF